MGDLRETASSPAGSLRVGLTNGLSKGWSGFVWMMKIVLPVSFLTTLFVWTGWLFYLDALIRPFTSLMGLPPEAALPLLIGMLANIYGAIAAMVVLPLDRGQMTLIAIFLLMAHNLIQEGIIQGQSGIHPFKATLFRIIAAGVTTAVAALWLGNPGPVGGAVPLVPPPSPPLTAVLGEWVETTFWLCVKIFFIIMAIMIVLEVLKEKGWIVHLVRLFSPLLTVMGLDRKVGFLWMTAIVFGLAYGGAVIVEEAKAEHLSRDELEMLHLSIGINHSMVEDPLLFLSLGLNPLWLYLPRLVAAVVSIHAIRFWMGLRRPGSSPEAGL